MKGVHPPGDLTGHRSAHRTHPRDALRTCATWHGWQARLGEAVLLAALRRTGNLGAHWRHDATLAA